MVRGLFAQLAERRSLCREGGDPMRSRLDNLTDRGKWLYNVSANAVMILLALAAAAWVVSWWK